MPNIATFSSSAASPISALNILFQSLSKKDPISPEMLTTLEQINILEYAGFIPSKEAILIKNNLQDELFAESILSDIILDLISQEKLAPEMKDLVSKKKLQESILFLYTCHLEETHSSLKPYIIQQQIWGCSPQKLLLRMKESQEMESKEYVTNWLSSLKFSNQECQMALEPLFPPLTTSEFKERFLSFLDTLYRSEQDFPHLFCLQELYDLVKSTPESRLFLVTSEVLKATTFYQKHIRQVEQSLYKDHQFSLCIAADAIKNAPSSGKLPMFYNLVYGQVKKSWETAHRNFLKKPVVILEVNSLHEKANAATMQKCFEKIRQPFYKIELPSLKDGAKKLVQSLIKAAPESIAAAIAPRHQASVLETAKSLNLPITFFPPFTEASKWEETSNNPYPDFRIAFPIPLSSEVLPEEINGKKTRVSGIPGVFENTKTPELLKKMWGFTPETKVIVIHSPEGDSPWPAYLAKEYKFSKNMTLAVVTDESNKEFIHKLKTNTCPNTGLPIKIYSSLTSLEKEELLTLADLIIDKERESTSALLFEANHARTPLLLDSCPPPLFSGGLFAFLSRIPSLFYHPQQSSKSAIQEKILNDQNLGIMIRSKENFRLSFEELLCQKTPIATPTHLAKTLPAFVNEMKAEARDQSNGTPEKHPLHFFTTQ